jgi:DMSO/TMAO reductase YedYZ molybdopterin-dependent catalytic subunit
VSIVKPLPEEYFTILDTNAEMRWEAMAGLGTVVPVDRFFVRNHTRTPRIDAETWRLRLSGDGLHGRPTPHRPVEFSYEDLLGMPAREHLAVIECAGNGRTLFATQQHQNVTGTAWGLGAIGVARWRGVPLAHLLERAGLLPEAVDLMPVGLDPGYVTGGVDLGPVRRPLPVSKALDDVLVAYEMNGVVLPPDHGFPARLVVPHWIGAASIKWIGRIDVSTTRLSSPWNTRYYRMSGPGYPPGGTVLGPQNTKSAFELPWPATLRSGKPIMLYGRSWSGTAPVQHVEVSTDCRTWRAATPIGRADPGSWQRWQVGWRPAPGRHTLRARAVDHTGARQPDTAPYNDQGYLFGAVAGHPVTVT